MCYTCIKEKGEVIMKNGLLIVNGFLKTDKFTKFYNLVIDAFYKKGIALKVQTNDSLLLKVDTISEAAKNSDFILFWDKDVLLAEHLSRYCPLIFNSPSAIAMCDDKRLTAIKLENSGIKTPKTVISPFTFSNIGYTNTNFLADTADYLGFPIVVKEAFGSFGQQVYLANDYDELQKIVEDKGKNGLLFQEFIKSSFGRDVRIQIIGGKAVASVLRTGEEGNFISNVTNGGKMILYDPPKEFIQMAVEVCDILKLDFAGVDIMFGINDNPILCEVNSNAHFQNITVVTKIDVAAILADYIYNKII